MLNIFQMLGASFTLVLGLMALLWVVYFFRRNATIVDVGWSLGFVLAVWVYFFLGMGAASKRLAIVIMVSLWGLRLAWHFYRRYCMTTEEPRYEEIRKGWGAEHSDFKFFMMFIFQGVLVVFLTLPFLIVASKATSAWHGVEVAAIFIWLVGFLGETWADQQLFDFKNKPENQGKVCREGFWHYSRHPNYFFEFIVWVAYFLFALGTPGGWVSIIAPAIMLCLLLKVSGIPLTEDETLRTKGADFEEYQRTTNPFVPWFPKK